MPRKALHHVTDPAVWQTLVAPVRLEILEALRMLAPCGIAAVAQQLDRQPTRSTVTSQSS
jgi:hypothetical protein